ncbi:MAG: DUF2062 domain-containing protein [Acidobacteriia bacterium]|jgi:uncharacterized protein (DUF2062 family)|nr:DUF2062 domain-containing protein [Terriglobia bacterium]
MTQARRIPGRRRGRLARIYRYAYLKLVRENDSPDRIGRGAGLGVFIGILPTLWFGPLLALLLAGPLRANRAAALAAMAATGPLMPLLWTAAVVVGNTLVAEERRIAPGLIEQGLAAILSNFLGTFLMGVTLVGTALAVLAYALGRWLATRFRQPSSRLRNARPAG